MITRADVQKLAELSLVAMPEAEIDTITGEIGAILGYVSELAALNDDAVGAPSAPEHRNIMRDDTEPHAGGQYSAALLAEMPDTDGKYLRVKKIL